MSKKTKGCLRYTAKDCRKKNEILRNRCNYDKTARAIDLINRSIEETLKCGGKSVQIGRKSSEDTVFEILVLSYFWAEEYSIYLSAPEWKMVVRELNDNGFEIVTVNNDKIMLNWSY